MKGWKFRYYMKSAGEQKPKSLRAIVDYVNRAAKTTNQRMRALEKADMTFYAYDPAASALAYLGRKRFKETWTMEDASENWEEFRVTARAVYRFTDVELHTTPAKMAKYSGARLDYVLNKLQEADPSRDYSTIMHPSTEEERSKRKFLERAISRGALSDIISAGWGSTGETFDAIESAYEEGASLEEINDRIAPFVAQLQYEGKNVTIQDIWKLIK